MILGEEISGGGSLWSRNDDIVFERALAIYSNESEICWEQIAAVVPGKSLEEIKEHYEILVHDVMMIELGCVPLPDYDFSEKTHYDKEISISECDNNRKCEFNQKDKSEPKQKRRKGIAWTADEHRQFLLGLEKFGKGDWRSISRKFVVTRTPTQVASHAQKYFLRLNSKNRNKKRQSIHDDVIDSTNQRPIMWQNETINVASTSNARATLQPSLNLPLYVTPNIWNSTQHSSQPSLDLPMYGTHNIWNMQAISQPSVNVPLYGQSMVRPMLSPYGTDMNRLAPSHMPYGVQHYSVPYSSVNSAPVNIGSAPYNMT